MWTLKNQNKVPRPILKSYPSEPTFLYAEELTSLVVLFRYNMSNMQNYLM